MPCWCSPPPHPPSLGPPIFPELCRVPGCAQQERAQPVPEGDSIVLLERPKPTQKYEVEAEESWNLEVRQSRSSWSRLGHVRRCDRHLPYLQPPASLWTALPHGAIPHNEPCFLAGLVRTPFAPCSLCDSEQVPSLDPSVPNCHMRGLEAIRSGALASQR